MPCGDSYAPFRRGFPSCLFSVMLFQRFGRWTDSASETGRFMVRRDVGTNLIDIYEWGTQMHFMVWNRQTNSWPWQLAISIICDLYPLMFVPTLTYAVLRNRWMLQMMIVVSCRCCLHVSTSLCCCLATSVVWILWNKCDPLHKSIDSSSSAWLLNFLRRLPPSIHQISRQQQQVQSITRNSRLTQLAFWWSLNTIQCTTQLQPFGFSVTWYWLRVLREFCWSF